MIAAGTLAAGLAAAVPQDDAGLGRDAPGFPWQAALLPGGGAYAGMLDPYAGDRADWYVVEAGPRTALRFILEHDGGSDFFLDIPGAGGQGNHGGGRQAIEDRFRWDEGGREERIVITHIGQLVFGVVAGNGGGSYKVELQFRELCDLRVDQVAERSDDPTGRRRVVTVAVTNQGPGACIHAGLGVQAEHREPSVPGTPAQAWWRDVGGAGLTNGDEFPPGATRVVEVPWDSLGEAGDGVLHVGTGSAVEGRWEDNGADLAFALGPAPVGVGTDLLNRGVATCDGAVVCGRFGVEHNGWRSGWVADWWSPRVPGGHQHIGTHPGGLAHADVDVWDPVGGADTDVGLQEGSGAYARLCLFSPYGGGCFQAPANNGPG